YLSPRGHGDALRDTTAGGLEPVTVNLNGSKRDGPHGREGQLEGGEYARRTAVGLAVGKQAAPGGGRMHSSTRGPLRGCDQSRQLHLHQPAGPKGDRLYGPQRRVHLVTTGAVVQVRPNDAEH